MDEILEIIIEYGGEFLVCICLIICNIFKRGKSQEELQEAYEKVKSKRLEKAQKKAAKDLAKAQKSVDVVDQIQKGGET